MTLQELEFSAGVARAIEVITGRPHGLTLFTGPTGSGKRFSINLLLESMSSNARVLPMNSGELAHSQSQVSAVVDAGELREDASAQIACSLASRTHVIGVLRSSESIFSIERLSDMGCQPNDLKLADPIIVTQRLCRRLCVLCRRPRTCTPSELQFLGKARDVFWTTDEAIYDRVGCDRCTQGFNGYVALYEVIRAEIVGADASQFQAWSSLIGDGIVKVLAGKTTIAELENVIPRWAMSKLGG